MKSYLILWIFLCLYIVEATVYYSNQIRKTYDEAEDFCNKTDGILLRYGELFNRVVKTCGQNLIEIWTGQPWYTKQRDCIGEPSGNVLKIPVVNTTSGVAVCADHCANKNFTQFAVQITECQCYNDDILALAAPCNEEDCLGNKFDICGKNAGGDPNSFRYTVYRKVYIADQFLPVNTCFVRTYANETSDGKAVSLDCSSKNLSFICQVGDTDDVICNLDEFLQTSITQTSFEPTPGETEQTSTDETTTSVELKPSETTFYSSSASSTHSSTPEITVPSESVAREHNSVYGIIIGIAVAVGILAIIVVIIVFVRKRRNSSPKPKTTEKSQEVKSSNIPFYSEVVPKFEQNKNNDTSKPSGNSDVSKAAHRNDKQAEKLITRQNEENHYTVNPEGVYDSADQHPSKLTNANTNLYNVSPEGVYDSASQHPAKPSNADTNIYNVNLEGVYDSAAHTAKRTETDIDNIYDHQLDDTYDVSTHKPVQDNPDIYDQTVIS